MLVYWACLTLNACQYSGSFCLCKISKHDYIVRLLVGYVHFGHLEE
jgi:hypothetical protein